MNATNRAKTRDVKTRSCMSAFCCAPHHHNAAPLAKARGQVTSCACERVLNQKARTRHAADGSHGTLHWWMGPPHHEILEMHVDRSSSILVPFGNTVDRHRAHNQQSRCPNAVHSLGFQTFSSNLQPIIVVTLRHPSSRSCQTYDFLKVLQLENFLLSICSWGAAACYITLVAVALVRQ